ncbi:MAG TPA: DsbE family thiol:disulfide interchange protein [Hellea balneolensis]|uniref:DsbE family thiol:disulfide interchange protein n=1 Tax=Hellea balneolensis TaxID=287478 RepID=A0A7V5NXJ6_9PROT|nr:DsbE family thiol:disulfide interchange protein [Hellea balneolensis]
MKVSLKALIPLMLFLALSGVFFIRLTDGKDTRILPSQLIDQEFPDFSLPDLFDMDKRLDTSIFNNRVVLVNVFGSWCVACLEEHPFLRALANRGEIPIIGIDWRDEPDKARAWLARHGNPYERVIFDHDSTLIIDLGVTGAPESFLVDRQGRIRYKYTGILTPSVWQKDVRPVLEHLEASP